MGSTAALTCPACKADLAPHEVLDACRGYWVALRSSNFSCPHCKNSTEIQLQSGLLSWGYSYAAGTVHFCAMIECPLEELQVELLQGGAIVSLGGRSWRLGPS